LTTGSILGLAQIGFAVASGILIDTFIVRTVLDPALATLFGRWTWWPGEIARSALEQSDLQPAPLSEPSGLD
jgi:RND superfamily putative drug exporter